MAFDIIAIGDTVIDDFIRLDNSSRGKIDEEKNLLCLPFRSKIPFEFSKLVSAVGNSPNAAVSGARLGLKTAIITNVGHDSNGKLCIDTFKKELVSTDFVRQHEDKKTNYHYVLWFENDRTILIKHEEFPYELPFFEAPKWLYLSSLGEHSLPFHEKIADYCAENPRVKLAFQPGTYQIKFGHESLRHIYNVTEFFVCNIEEAQLILNTTEADKKKLLSMMRELGPKIVVLTDGPLGAYLSYANENWFIPLYPDHREAYERTGAGDAFASTFVSALALGKSPLEAFAWAPVNSMSVVQKIGAQEGLLSRTKLEELLKKAISEEEWRPQKI